MKIIGWIGLVIALLACALVLAGQLGALAATMPQRQGVKDGKLVQPSRTPNSVSSQASLYPGHPQQAYAAMEPFRLKEEGGAAMRKLAGQLRAMRGAQLITDEPDYLYAQFSTPVLKFTDDVEFWLDRQAGVIHFRSASRIGRKDFGVNRARMETIRAQLGS
ncbi:MAG: DUF1499 domain-containing protein [Burkholderiaceae bacterium]